MELWREKRERKCSPFRCGQTCQIGTNENNYDIRGFPRVPEEQVSTLDEVSKCHTGDRLLKELFHVAHRAKSGLLFSFPSLFSLPPFFSQCFVRRTKRAWTKRNIQTDGLIGETIDWPRSGKFFSIDLRSVGSVNFLYILRALVLPLFKVPFILPAQTDKMAGEKFVIVDARRGKLIN